MSLSNRGFCDINSSPIYSCRLFWRGTIPLCIPAPSGMSEFQDEYERIFNNGVIRPDMSICWLMSLLNISDIVRKIEQTYYSPHLRDYFHYPIEVQQSESKNAHRVCHSPFLLNES